MLMTGIREELRLRKVGTKEAAEGKSQRKECQAFFSLSSCAVASCSAAVSFMLCDLDEITALYESWERSLDVCLNVNFF